MSISKRSLMPFLQGAPPPPHTITANQVSLLTSSALRKLKASDCSEAGDAQNTSSCEVVLVVCPPRMLHIVGTQ